MKNRLKIVLIIAMLLLILVSCQAADSIAGGTAAVERVATVAEIATERPSTATPASTSPVQTILPSTSPPTTVSETETPAPPTETAVITDATTLNRRQFFALLSGYNTAVTNQVILIQQQLTNPQLDDPTWLDSLSTSASEINNSYAEILNIEVPRQGTQPHQRAADAIAVCETASTLILEAAIANDLDQMNQVAADLAGCADELLSLNSAFGQEGGNGRQGEATPAPTFEARGCDDTSIGFTPLIDLVGQEMYQGFEGGLYPGGSNSQPAEHAAAGLALAEQIQPIDGNIVILSIGMSNVRQEFDKLIEVSSGDNEINPQILLVNGAVSGRPAQTMDEESDQYWELVDKKLSQANKTPDDVQVVWLKQAHAYPGRPFPADAQIFQSELQSIVHIIGIKYPNVKMIYLSSRIYAGYASANLHPEPYAYQSGFSVKWLIEDYINGNLPEDVPWLAWGPYLWADGTTPRSDGLIWECDDVIGDGTHPGDSGREKVAQLWLQFFKSNSTTRTWFLRQP